MKRILLLLCALLTFGVSGAWAETVTWESKEGFTQASGGKANVSWFGVHTPGDAATKYSFTSLQLMQETDGKANTCYLAIARVSATSRLNVAHVVAVSDNSVSPASNGTGALETYNFSEGVDLLGNTTYYFVFLSSNTPTDGSYSVQNGRISLNHNDYGAYAYGNSAGGANWWPYFKATVESSTATGFCTGDDLGGSMASGNWKNTWTSGTSPAFTMTSNANNINNSSGKLAGGLDIRSGSDKTATYTLTAPTGKFITGYKLFGRALTTNQTVTPSVGGSAVTFTTNGNSLCVSGIKTLQTTFTLTDSNNSGLFLHALQVDFEDITSVTSTSGLSNTKKYNIINNRGWWVVNTDETDLKSTTELSLAASTSDTKQQFAFIYYDDATDDSNDGYYLYSVSEGKFIYKNGTKLSLSSLTDGKTPSKVTFAASTNSTYNSWAPVVIQIDGYSFGVHTSQTPDIYQYSPHLEDGGNASAIYETGSFDATDALAALQDYFHPTHTITYIVKDAEDNELYNSGAIDAPLGTYSTFPEAGYRNYFYTYTDMTPVTIDGESASNTNVEIVATPKSTVMQYTTDTSSPIYYNLNIRSKYLVYDAENSAKGYISLQETSDPFNPNAAWAFIGNPYDGFKIINQAKGTGDFLTYTSVVTGANNGNNNITFVPSAECTSKYWMIEANNNGFCMRMKENMNIYFHHDNNNNFLRTCSVSEWGSVHNDAGSTLTFASDEQVLQDLYDALKDVYFGENIGLYTWGGSGTSEEARANIDSANTALTAHATSLYKDLYDDLLAIQPNISLNTPTAGFYRLKNLATGKYLNTITATNNYQSDVRGVYANGSATDAATVIEFRDKNGDGNLYMYNQSYGYGWVVANPASSSEGMGVAYAVASPDKYINWFTGGGANRIAFAICLGNGTGSYASYLKRGIFTADTSDETVIGGTDETIDAARWTIEAATSATIPMNAGGDGNYYATMCLPYDVTISNANAYTLALDGDWAVPTQVPSNQVPAGTAVLLKGTNEAATATINTGDSFGDPIANILTGTYLATTINGENDFVLGRDNLDENTTGVGFYHWTSNNLGANRAYLTALTVNGSLVKGFSIRWDEEVDGVNAAKVANTDANVVYDLQGRRVSKPARGLYIVNGKKVAVK